MVAPAKVLLYVLYYDETSKIMAETTCKQAAGSLKPKKVDPHPLFESQFYLTNYADNIWSDFTYVGTIAYNYHEKRGIPQSEVWQSIFSEIGRAETEAADVIVLNPAPDIVKDGNVHGEVFQLCWIGLLARLGYSMKTMDSRHPICYNNYWLAKPKAMLEYCKFVRRAWNVLLASPDLLTLFDADAQWNSRLTEAQLIKIFNKPYYAMYPFVFERMSGFFFSVHEYRIYLCMKEAVEPPESVALVKTIAMKTVKRMKSSLGPIAIIFGVTALILAIYFMCQIPM